MRIGRLRNKAVVIVIIVLLSGILLFLLYRFNLKKDIYDGNFTKPIINIDGYIYGTTMDEKGEIIEDYTFYGYIKNASEEMIGIPDNDLEVSNIIKDNIGYKVYLSKDKEFVAVYNEQAQKYDYFKRIAD